MARNTLILLRQATERGGLPLTTTGNLSCAVVAEMRTIIEWPGYDQVDAFRLHKVINEFDVLPLHVVRLSCGAACPDQPPTRQINPTRCTVRYFTPIQQGGTSAHAGLPDR